LILQLKLPQKKYVLAIIILHIFSVFALMYIDWFALNERLPLFMFIDFVLLLIIAGNRLFKGVPMYIPKIILAILTGILLSISWCPSTFVYPIFFGLVPLLVVIHSILKFKPKNYIQLIFWYSYLSFLTWNIFTTWWVSNSTLAGGIFAVFVNSFLMTLPFLSFVFIYKNIGNKAYLILPFLFITFEYFHLNWDLSWPWLTLGNAFCENNEMIQWYEYTGVFGGSLWIWISNLILFYTITFISWQSRKIFFLIYISIVFVPIIFSYYLYINYKETGKKVLIAAIQPNIDPWSEKFDASTEIQQLDNLITLSKNAIENEKVEILLWPETALPFGVWINKNRFYENSAIQYIQKELIYKYPQIQLLSGIAAYEDFSETASSPYFAIPYQSGNGKYAAYNSMILIDTSKKIQHYIKSKLVVGTESIPFYKYLKKYIANTMISIGGTSVSLGIQKERIPMQTSKGKLASIVCYESIYGEFLNDFYKNNALALLISTNDAWWGNTAGYKQHNAYARLRAIEARKCVVRSANTGKSSFIDQCGNEIKSTEYNTRTYLCGEIFLNDCKTFYVMHGDYIAKIAILISVISCLLSCIQYLYFKFK
jgi:apolipoprotein N-acyltransferase